MEKTMQSNFTTPLLPLSLRQRRARSITLRITVCVLLLLLFIFVIITWGDKLFPSTLKSRVGYTGLKAMFYILLLSIPFIISGVPFKLINCSWSGTVIAVTVEENLKASGAGRPRLSKSHNLILTIKTDKGKEIEHTILSFDSRATSYTSGKIHHHEHKIAVGDRVYKYYGFKYLYIIPQKHHEHKSCIVCGAKNKIKDKKCWSCDSELLFDPQNLYK